MKHQSIWVLPPLDGPSGSTEHVMEYMNELGEQLRDLTSGKVYGRFIPIGQENSGPGQSGHGGIPGPSDGGPQDLERYDPFASPPELYAFEICNASYRFRLLEMTIPPVYPLQMIVNKDVLDDVRDVIYETTSCEDPPFWLVQDKPDMLMIDSDEGLTWILETLIPSQKVQYVLHKLLQMDVPEKIPQ